MALLSIKLNQPAGRTKNPVLHPSVSQGLLFPEYLCWLLFPPLILCSSHSQNQKTSPRASPAKRDVSESPGWCWPRTGWEKGREGRMMLVSPSGELSWLWEADGKTNILCVTQGSPDRDLSLRARLDTLPRAPGCVCGIAPQTICPCLCHSGMRTSRDPSKWGTGEQQTSNFPQQCGNYCFHHYCSKSSLS